MFIGADPYGRRHLSPRRSVVLYTADGRFGYALNERPSEPHAPQAVRAGRRALLVERRLIAPRHTRRALGKAEARLAVCAHVMATNRQRPAVAQPCPLGGSRRRGRLAIPRWTTPRRFDKNSPRPKCHPAPPISLFCCATRGLARVDGQNAQKAKIARYAGCEHNRDAVRADP